MAYDPRYTKFFELFNERDFYECHEVLEDLWMETPGPERQYLQGLIQTATSFYHLENANWAGARKLMESGLKYLEPYPDDMMGFGLGDYKTVCRRWLDLAKRKQRGEDFEIDVAEFPVLESPAA